MTSCSPIAPATRLPRLLLGLALLFACTLSVPREAAAINILLRWTAPGDDSTFGRAAEYDLRYSFRASQFPSRFSTATRVPTPEPGEPGTVEEVTVADMPESTQVYFALRTRDEFGNWSMVSNVLTTFPTLDADGSLLRVAFSKPTPSPATVRTRFELALPRKAESTVEAIDIAGRRVRLVQKGELDAGVHAMEWDLRDDAGHRLRPGVFFLRARTGDEEFLRRVVVLR